MDIRRITIPEGVVLSADRNPNCLVYISQEAENANNLPNLVKVDNITNTDTAETVTLKDGYDFYNKIPFQGNVTYTRHLFDGWSTLALPFPYTINEERIEKYRNVDSDCIQFNKVTGELTANTAYLIHMDIVTDKIFSATNVEVPVTTVIEEDFKSKFAVFTMSGDEHLLIC